MTSPLRADVVNAFITPVMDVVKSCVGLNAEVDSLAITQHIDPPPSLSVTIDVQGGLVGQITWIFTQELAARFATHMLPGVALGDDAHLYGDAVSELANIVTGNATGQLTDAGYEVEIRTPRLHGPDDHERRLAERTLVVTLRTDAGDIKILIGLRIAETEGGPQ